MTVVSTPSHGTHGVILPKSVLEPVITLYFAV